MQGEEILPALSQSVVLQQQDTAPGAVQGCFQSILKPTVPEIL